MGTKKAPAHAAKKARAANDGPNIMRFFDKQGGAHHGEHQHQDSGVAPGREISPAPQAAAAERTPGGPVPAPGVPKQLAALQDLAPADTFMMSQDTEGMQVVWHDSPSSGSQPPGRGRSNLGRGAARAPGAPGSGPQELHAIKQRLISAAQRPRDVRRPGGAAGAVFAGSGAAAGAVAGAARLLQSEQLLEGLLAPPKPATGAEDAAAAAAASAAAGAATQEPSFTSGGLAEPGAAPHRTPGTHLRSILKRRGGGPAGSASRHTPASSVLFSLNGGSTSHKRRAGGGQLGSSGKKRQAGQKRKALLELLEQVENIVHSGGSGGGAPSPADSPAGEAAHGDDKAGAVAAGVAAPAKDAGAASDKENARAAAAASRKHAGGSQSHHGGFTTSQQLMPPPGGLPCRGGQPPADHAAQQQDRQHREVLPAAAQQEELPATQAVAAQAPAFQQGAGGSGAGFGGFDDDDEDDALMAQLELELLTQVEQRHAAKQVAAGGAKAAPTGAARPNLAGREAGTSAAAPARPQAAPPAAQHPAEAAQQQGQRVSLRPQQQQQQRQEEAKALPPSPYDKQGLPRAGSTTPGAGSGPPVAAADAAGKPVAAVPQAAGLAAAAAPAAGQQPGTDGGWDDDDEDLDLLDQFEAAALKERADRSLSGQPPTSGRQEQQPAVAEGGQQPAGAGAAEQRYPGNREEVHYTIREIFPGGHEQVLLLHNKYQKRDVYAHLHAPWCDLPYRVGDTVNILAELDYFEGHHHCLLNMDRGMLILHPDVLLSGTRITTSNECPRRSFLDERVAEDGSNDKAVKGTLTHNLIQDALVQGLRTPPQLVAAAERIVGEATEALLQVELSEEAAMETLRQAVPGIIRWMHRFLRSEPAPDALLGAGFDYATGKEIRRAVSVCEVVDIEESIWSTKYGVKGMIDVSAGLTLDDLSQQRPGAGAVAAGWMQQASGAAAGAAAAAQFGREVTVGPVEIKTGKMHDSHRAQVLLYLLLMEERYGKPLDWGMLWYTGQPEPQLVVKRPADLACLMAVRNRLAAAIAHKEMPLLSDEKRQCNWCFQQHNCALAHKAERGADATPDSFVRSSTDRGGNLDKLQQELATKYEQAAGHMTPEDCEFLKKWEGLVTLEEGQSSSRRPEIWTMAGEQRQALGRCVAGLALSHVDEQQLLYTFCRTEGGAVECTFQEGEMLLLSVQGQHAAVARGFFYTCSATHLTVSLNKALRKGLLRPGFAPSDAAAASGGAAPVFDASVRWRLDRDDVSSTYVRLRGNLYALFRREFQLVRDPQTGRAAPGPNELPRSAQAARLRRLIVALDAPCYAACDPTQPDPTPPGMNSEQHSAVERVLCALDYTLVLGMPGAGKTTTIVSMVQALVKQGKSVLLTSYTNSAVDNILMKLAREEVPFVRLGRESGVHPAVRPWVPGGERYPRKTTRELAALAERTPVFGATCFGVGHAMLKDKVFDVCIIDEAGQMVLPASLGPLLKARTFVLVGDHNQLPPLVACREAEAGGYGQSLFKRLSEAHPQSVVRLPVQYRMAADIMLLPNTLIYNNALRCGTDGVAQGVLRLGPGAGPALAALPAWLQAALDPQRRVLFLDTALVEGAQETVAGDALCNAGEAQLAVRVLQAAVAAGVAPEELGVISPYRSQVALLDRQSRQGGLQGVEVLTIDKCQGRDKDCVLLSLVRSNADGEAGKLLADWRRINVAITRAKTKLLLLGNASTLASIPLFNQLVALTRQRGWYLQLPSAALAGG